MITDLTTQELQARYEPKPVAVATMERQVHLAQFSPTGNRLLAVGYDGRIRLWDMTAETPAELATSDVHQGWAQGLAVAPVGETVFTADSFGRLQCMSYKNDVFTELWHLDDAHDGWIRCLALSPDGKTLLSAGRDSVVISWDSSDGKKLASFEAHEDDVYRCVFHPGGQQFATGDAKGLVHLWNLTDSTPLKALDASELFAMVRLQDVGGVHTLEFSRDGARLFVGGTRPKNGGNVQGEPLLLVFDVESGGQELSLDLGPAADVYLRHVQEHPDGFLVAATSGNPNQGKLHLLRLGDKEPFFTNTSLSNCHHVSIHPNGQSLAVTTTSPGSNGNGRPLKDGKYVGNHSVVRLLSFAAAETE